MTTNRTATTSRRKKTQLRFKIGDKVVYPNHGVGIIEKIDERAIAGERRTFYSLRILSSETTVMVPVGNSQAVGLRKILGPRKVTQVLKDAPPRVAASILASVGVLLQLDLSGESSPEFDTELSRQAIFDGVLEMMRWAAGRQPVILAIEDTHWIDHTSRDLLDHLIHHYRQVSLCQ